MANKKNKKKKPDYTTSPDSFMGIEPLLKNNLASVMIAAVAAFVPLIVYLRVVPLNADMAKFWPSDVNYDFFSFYILH